MKQSVVVASLIWHFVVVSTVAQENGTTTTTDTGFDQEGCPCLFDGKDPDDCIVWGALKGELKAWPLADQACLDAYEIKIEPPDATLICGSANSFVLGLKNIESSQFETLKFGLGIPYGGFWEESPTNPDIPVLKDSITIDGTTYDCTVSESDCYNAMVPYFESNPDGMAELETVCTQLKNGEFVARELEQSTLRVRICNEDREGTVIAPDCSMMALMMESDLQTHSTMNCGGFGMGPGGLDPPTECEGGGGGGGDGGDGDDSGSFSYSDMRFFIVMILGAMCWMF